MFWHMAGLSTASPVEAILDKDTFTLEDLLDEDEIIQECRALNGRLIGFLRERSQVKQLVQYIVEEAPEGASKQHLLKFPFVASEIFICEVDLVLKILVEDEELMGLLFSFLDPEHHHSSQSAGYFSKVVVCMLLRKTASLMNYIRDHQDIIRKLVDLIGITSIMEVLIRLIGSDEHIYANCGDSIQWLEDMDILEMITDKFSLSDCPKVHANAAETLCIIARWAPPGLASKVSSHGFVRTLFSHALEESRPKSVLVNLLVVCMSLLDPKRLTTGVYYMYNRQTSHGAGATANPDTVRSMLESLGDLLKLLDVSSEDHTLQTTYGKLQPPLGKSRLKIIDFISVLVAVSSDVAEKELIRLGAVKRILELFFQYPYNNFLHHHVEQIVISFLGSKNHQFVQHILRECDLVGKILQAENFTLAAADGSKPTVPADGKSLPRMANIGHLTIIANKLVQLANSNSDIQKLLQENSQWVDWQANVLHKRNALENVYEWACGRPRTLRDQARDSDGDDDYQDKDYDVAALANNLSQAFKYGIYSNDANDEGDPSLERDDDDDDEVCLANNLSQAFKYGIYSNDANDEGDPSLERDDDDDDEDVYFDDESAEVVISSLRLGDNPESGGGSLFTNSNWFAYEDERIDENEHSTAPLAGDVVEEDDAISKTPQSEADKTPEWVEWRECSDTPETTTQEAMPNEVFKSEADKPDYAEQGSAETTEVGDGDGDPPSPKED